MVSKGKKETHDKEASREKTLTAYLSTLKSSKYWKPIQDWSHKWQIIKAQLQLGGGDLFVQHKKAIAAILHYSQMADLSFIIYSIRSIMQNGRKDRSLSADDPLNFFTMLAGYIKLEWGSQQVFEVGNSSNHNGKIYLQFAILCNADQNMLLEMIALD